jgi:hypothetical protein
LNLDVYENFHCDVWHSQWDDFRSVYVAVIKKLVLHGNNSDGGTSDPTMYARNNFLDVVRAKDWAPKTTQIVSIVVVHREGEKWDVWVDARRDWDRDDQLPKWTMIVVDGQ